MIRKQADGKSRRLVFLSLDKAYVAQQFFNSPPQRTCCPPACLFKRTCSPAFYKIPFKKTI